MGSPAYVVKSPRAASLGREVRELVRQVAPEAPVYREFTTDFLAQRSMVQLSFTMLTLGVVSALASTRLLDALLYEVNALDPVVFVAMPIMTLGIGLLARMCRRVARATWRRLRRCAMTND